MLNPNTQIGNAMNADIKAAYFAACDVTKIANLAASDAHAAARAGRAASFVAARKASAVAIAAEAAFDLAISVQADAYLAYVASVTP